MNFANDSHRLDNFSTSIATESVGGFLTKLKVKIKEFLEPSFSSTSFKIHFHDDLVNELNASKKNAL